MDGHVVTPDFANAMHCLPRTSTTELAYNRMLELGYGDEANTPEELLPVLADCPDYHTVQTLSPYPIVCLCGSTRFITDFIRVSKEMTLKGYVVLAPEVFGGCGDVITEEQKVGLDKLHRTKIDLCTEILVINTNGYIGDSTSAEIVYAESLGKHVGYTVGEHEDS